MKEFLFSIISGLNKNDINKKDKQKIYDLKDKGFIVLAEDEYVFAQGIVCGEMDVSISNKGFLKPYTKSDADYLILRRELKAFKKGDIVIGIEGKNFRGRKTAKPVYLLESLEKIILAYTKNIGKKVFLLSLKTDDVLHTTASQKSLKALPNQSILQIDRKDNEIKKVIGVLSDPKIDEQICLSMFERKESFSYKSKTELKAFGETVDISLYPNRKDLRKINFITIDPMDAKDHDDAIFYDKEENKLLVAIADVSEYVSEFSSLDAEALTRGFSIYLPHKSIPMLPRVLSENLCSLKLEVDRLAFICEISFDKDYNIIDEVFYESVINVHKNYTYDQVEEFLEKETSKEIEKNLQELWSITRKIKKQRLKKGSDFTSSETKIILDSNQMIKKTKISHSINSHSLVEECMLLANKASAKILGNEGIFRVHKAPDLSKISDVSNNILALGVVSNMKKDATSSIKSIQKATPKNLQEFVDVLLIKAQNRAVYNQNKQPHFALGFDAYTHFTSPIRRYSDLLTHRLIKSIIKKDNKDKHILKTINYKCQQINDNEEKISKIEMDFKDRKYARWAKEWMTKNKNKSLNATVVDLKKDPLCIVDDEIYGLRVFLKSYDRDMKLFDKIKIKITNADILSTRISGEMA